MNADNLIDFYQKKTDPALKLEHLKCRARVRDLKLQQDATEDEYWKEHIQISINREEKTMAAIDDVWFYRHGVHIPSDDE